MLSEQKQLLDERGFSDPIVMTSCYDLAEKMHLAIMEKQGVIFNPSEIVPICNEVNIKSVIETCLGRQALIWRARGFRKTIGDKAIPWHHDKHFQNQKNDPIDFNEIEGHLSIYIAFDDITESNGALIFLEGTHLHVEGLDRDTRIFREKTMEEHINPSIPDWFIQRSTTVPMPALHFIVFHPAIFHRSNAFQKGDPRCALAIRLVKDASYLSPEDSVEAVRIFED